jgi:aminoglycoside 6'-N-acetyltransferase I
VASGGADVAIRIATPADLDAVLDVQRRADRSRSDAFRDHTAEAIEDPSLLFIIATVDGEPVGWAMTSHFAAEDGDAPAGHYLMGITVVPEVRRRGIATRLVRTRLDWIHRRADAAYFFTNARNAASIELHRRLGFRELVRGARFRGVPFDGGVGILFGLDLVSDATT